MLSSEMLTARAGNFTASQNYRLMTGWDATPPKVDFEHADKVIRAVKSLLIAEQKPLVGAVSELAGFKVSGDQVNQVKALIKYAEPSQGLVTYAQEKALETLFTPDPLENFSTAATRIGEEREVECIELLSDRLGVEFCNIGEEQIHLSVDDLGATPDGIVYNEFDLIETGAEVKCKTIKHHAEMLLVRNQEQLRRDHLDYYTQTQTQIEVTGASVWHFACYNPHGIRPEHRLHHLEIAKDAEFLGVMRERLEVARGIKQEFINQIMELAA